MVPAWLRSALTSVIAVGAVIGVIAAAGVFDIPADVVVWTTLAVSIARTVLVALNPADPSYGIGSHDDAEDDRYLAGEL